MGNFSNGKKFGDKGGAPRFGGKPSFGGRSFGGGNDRDRGGFGGGRDTDRVMYKAVCTTCGKGCEVPFRPSGDKPVYCSDCFKSQGPDNSRTFRDDRRSDFGGRDARPRFEEKRPYAAPAPVHTENYKARFDMLESKIDRILTMLSQATTKPATQEHVGTRTEKPARKEIDTVALKNTLTKVLDTTAPAKKAISKKVVTPTKKVAPKKVAAKKTTKK
jgi:CxxC-x17-CxxC domain-containing protein